MQRNEVIGFVVLAAFLTFLSFIGNVDGFCTTVIGADASWCSSRAGLLWLANFPVSVYVSLYLVSLGLVYVIGMRYAKRKVADQLALQTAQVNDAARRVNQAISSLQTLRSHLESIPKQVDERFFELTQTYSQSQHALNQGRESQIEGVRQDLWNAFGELKTEVIAGIKSAADELRAADESLLERIRRVEDAQRNE